MKENLNKNLPLISILVPMYNTEKTIKRCIQSVLKQTYTNIEIVLLDDGSVDNTYNIAKSLADTDSRIKLLQKPNEKNLSKTRNYLLDNYSGQYVMWLDSDDVLHKKYVERLYSTLIKTNADLAICGFSLQFANLPLIQPLIRRTKIFTGRDIYANIMLNQNIGFSLWNKIFKRELIDNIKFDENVYFGEDFVFVLNYIKKVKSIAFTNSKLYKYIVRPGSETTKKFSHKKMSFVYYLEDLLSKETNEDIKSNISAWLSITGNLLLFTAKRSKYDNIEDINKLYEIIEKYKEAYKSNKNVRLLHRFIMWLGKRTWARKKRT